MSGGEAPLDPAVTAHREGKRVERQTRLAEEASDAGAFRRALLDEGIPSKEVLEMVLNWQGYRWSDEGTP